MTEQDKKLVDALCLHSQNSEIPCAARMAMYDAAKRLSAHNMAEERIRARIAAIAPDVEGVDGAEFDIGCIQGLKVALEEIAKGAGEHGEAANVG